MEQEIRVMIDNEKCSGCGLCVTDCQRRVRRIQDKKAVITGTACFHCGHCIAICPANAVKITGLNDTIREIPGTSVFLDEESLLTHLKFRRSIRQYKNTPVEKEKLEKIIEAGRLTPTASNTQNVRYIVVQKDKDVIEDEVIAEYREESRDNKPINNYTSDRFVRGFLFHHAPAIILVISPSEINACLAAMNMELMAEALGLGVVYVGLFTRPANKNQKLRGSLGIAEDEIIAACLALGYPKVRYLRSAPKKNANIVWR
ncbi:MAG: nitroreductase family protein [Spirochaetaceae bacterium]|nr:nitroreductase family protein [Spirochaetaceae bacterium]